MPGRARVVALVLIVAVSGCAPGTEREMARARFSKDHGCALDDVSATHRPDLSAHDLGFGKGQAIAATRAQFDAQNKVHLVSGCGVEKHYFCRRGDRNKLQCIRANATSVADG